jgi:glycosyltransferase involved in cell wall biosynthesis
MTDISIIIPAFNEAKTIADIITRIERLHIPNKEIIVVDDGSTDETAQQVTQGNVRCISHGFRRGNGSAIYTGITAAKGAIVVILDGDGQHNPEDIPRFLAALNNRDMVIGQRTNIPFSMRKIANMLFNLIGGILFNYPIKDLTCGFKAFRKDKIYPLRFLIPEGFSFDVTMTLAFIQNSLPIEYVPVLQNNRVHGSRSKILPLRDGLNFLIIIFKLLLYSRPLKFFLPLSVVLFLLGAWWCCAALFYARPLPLGAMLLLMASLMFFCFSVIIDHIILLRKQIDHINKQ